MDTPSRRGVTPSMPSGLPRHLRSSSLSPKKPIPAPRFSQTLTPRPASLIFGKPVTEADLGLVDWQNVQDADLSADLSFGEIDIEDKAEDKVLVTVRVKPSGAESEIDKATREAWNIDYEKQSIKLKPHYVRPACDLFKSLIDTVLTGTDNKTVYASTAKAHVRAAMDGYNSVVFAYGQTASGKTFTLSGSEDQPGIIPRAMRDVFGYIKKHSNREFLLRASYLEIYNEQIYDLLAPPTSSTNTVTLQGVGNNACMRVIGVREEPITSFKSVKEVLERGNAGRRTASTDWNERSSRSHSVFRLVIESRETLSESERLASPEPVAVPMTPGGSKLQARGGRSVQMSTLSLIDLAGSEKATSDKDRTREGKYINTSLLTLGSVIGTLAENSARGKHDHVPFRNSKLTRLLQPSLSGDARISVICTLNPHPSAIGESTSTLQFAARVKKVSLHATKKEVVDTDALLEKYRKEIEDLKRRLDEREKDAPSRNRRLSAREKEDESKAMHDLNHRIKQLTKLILTSQTVDEGRESRPASPVKVDFDASPYQLQQDLLGARRTIESQERQILSLEAALVQRPLLPSDAPESDKDRLIADLSRTVRELEIVTKGYEDNLGAPLRQVREDVEREWSAKLEEKERILEEKLAFLDECQRALQKEKHARIKLEEEKLALVSFVRDFDTQVFQKAVTANYTPGGTHATERTKRARSLDGKESLTLSKKLGSRYGASLLDETPELLEEEDDVKDSVEIVPESHSTAKSSRGVLGDKENIPL
ncbi:Kinesin-related protein 11 OS=Dictyostelium discoideum GN=kif11 PE=3 SV=1 [Rhizoctonia solani AG-1 IB]|uniref:Kinesin-like protein n=1 Tax=Thanatephorus cucumeris (strain AG1-IB / isolate 7/3/14) TaxID=1108050 RepID=A0A0B7F6G1_THACB|nr:Kinesin-related protein 11 OS=Dictyostelium discoideum GN=kif11 PE=3 SV=1 [Rhizoctonia solani AG-1 IB]